MKIITISSFAQWLGVGLVIGLAAVGLLAVVLLIVWMNWAAAGRYERFERGGGRHGRS